MKSLPGTIRFVLFLVMTFSVYGLWWVASWFIPNKLYWRQIIFRIWSRGWVRLSRMQIEVIGTPPQAPFFLVSNHLSYADIPVIRSVVEGIFVAKGEISTWPAAGKIVGDIGNIYVNRQNKRDIPRAGMDVLNALERGEGVIVFPEGTSSRGEEVLPFKSSFLEFAAQTGLPVHYVSLSYATTATEPPPSHSICWWDDTPLMEHMIRFFSLTDSKAILTFGEEPLIAADRKELSKGLWRAVRDRFIPMQ